MTSSQMGKRCICGRSKAMPLCDGSHKAAGWQCSNTQVETVGYAFSASPSLVNIADRLAHRFNGTSLHAYDGVVQCEQWVIVTDGHQVDLHQTMAHRVRAQKTVVIGVDMDPTVVCWAFPNAQCLSVHPESPSSLWRAVESAVKSPQLMPVQSEKPTVFLSHAVQDEAAMFPAIESLRNDFGVPLFLCADSIPSGCDWQQEILDHLRRCDRFVFALSKSANASVFCGFEAGMAVALNKPIHLVSLDGEAPPAHLQSIQAIDVVRLKNRKPWLGQSDAILEALLEAIRAESSTDCND